MKHVILQSKLNNKKKGIEGKMNCCNFCCGQKTTYTFDPCVTYKRCSKSQDVIDRHCLCARAYNKMCKNHTKNKKS